MAVDEDLIRLYAIAENLVVLLGSEHRHLPMVGGEDSTCLCAIAENLVVLLGSAMAVHEDLLWLIVIVENLVAVS